ncbi:DUF7352 domain-containing protein [Cohnella yongneupensis]|uniref:DUF7352 domain-containing protein n=1 Tax=Cohnella yongneupensis TaxID=425006 RepID=A0ABW0QXW0_9BACL
MPVIHKFRVLPINEVQHIEMPVGSEITSVIEQHGNVMVYGLINCPDNQTEKIPVMCVGTGWELNIPDHLSIRRAIGTVKIGHLVWHVLELEDIDQLPF